jgi:hypothetical protein
MDTTEIIFSLAIAILYPFFFNKLTKQIVGYDSINDMCKKYERSYEYNDFHAINSFETKKQKSPQEIEAAEKCRNERNDLIDKADLHSHFIMLFIALVSYTALQLNWVWD